MVVKVRVTGIPVDLWKFVEILEDLEAEGIISVEEKSDHHKNRGESKYVRQYIEMELYPG